MGAAAAPLPGSTAEGEMMPPATGEGNEAEVLQTVSGRLSMLFLGTTPSPMLSVSPKQGGLSRKWKHVGKQRLSHPDSRRNNLLLFSSHGGCEVCVTGETENV